METKEPKSTMLTLSRGLMIAECIPVVGPLFFLPTLITGIIARSTAPTKEIKSKAMTPIIWSISILALHSILLGILSAL